jgi:hypothetical protein
MGVRESANLHENVGDYNFFATSFYFQWSLSLHDESESCQEVSKLAERVNYAAEGHQ